MPGQNQFSLPTDPTQVDAMLQSKRDRLQKVPPEIRNKILGLFFDRSVRPQLQNSGLNPEEMKAAQDKWTRGIMGEAPTQIPKEFGQRPPEQNLISGLATGTAASFYGTLANLIRDYQKVSKLSPTAGLPGVDLSPALDRPRKALESYWSDLSQKAKEESPTGAAIGGFIGAGPLSEIAGEAGAGLVPALAKYPIVSKILKGAAGGAASGRVFGGNAETAKSFAEWGAAFGLVGGVFGGVKGKLFKKTVRTIVKAEESGALPKTNPEQKVSILDGISNELFSKKFDDLDPGDKVKVGEEIQKRAETAKKTKGGVKAKDLKEIPKNRQTETEKVAQELHQKSYDSLGAAEQQQVKDEVQKRVNYRKNQYDKLRALKIDVGRGSPAYNAIHNEGKTADDIITQIKLATQQAVEETPEVKKAVGGVLSTAPEGVPIKAPTVEAAAKEFDKLSPAEQHNIATEINVRDAKTSVRDQSAVTEKPPEHPGEPPITVIPPGVSGLSDRDRKLLDRLGEVRAKISDTKISPLAKDALKKTERNIKNALGGDEEASRKLADSAKTAQRRAEGGARAKIEYGFDPGSEEGAPGHPVQIAGTSTPSVELIDSLKGLNIPGLDVSGLHKTLEGYRKTGISEEHLKGLTDSVYRTIGNKLGIEDADEMPLEDLYKRVTAMSGPSVPQHWISVPQDVVQRDPAIAERLHEFSNLVGHNVLMSTPDLKTAAGVNLGASWYKKILEHFGDESKADSYYLSALDKMGLDKFSKHLLDLSKNDQETSVVHSSAEYETMVHELSHTLADKLGVPFNRLTPQSVIEALKREVPENHYPADWIKKTHEAYTEVLTQYFMRNWRKVKGLSYLRPGDFTYNLAEHLIMSNNDLAKKLIGWALGTALAVTGAYKEGSNGSVNNGRTSGAS